MLGGVSTTCTAPLSSLFAYVPTAPTTSTVTVQVAPPIASTPPLRLSDEPPAAANAVPPQVLVTFGAGAFLRPGG